MSEQSSKGQQDMVTFKIDGKDVTVPKGTLIIRAAEQMGIMIPRFCDHPLLDPIGACRQCVVDVEGQRKPLMACTSEAMEGWDVKTHLTSEVAEKAQRGTLEFLLLNHPLDCPMCDKGGECPLQDQALEHGSNESRFVEQKRRYDKPVAVSPLVLLDRERCVLCARCTRFSEQISGDPFIELFERGALEQVAIYEDEPYESYFSGNVIQICPVGALTSTDYRFKARPFDTRSSKSVCNHCSAGCNLTIQSRRGEVSRVLARTNMAVNEAWSCDKGRFGFVHLTADNRLRVPMLRPSAGADLQEASWAGVLGAAKTAIAAANQAGPGRVAVLAGGRLPDEDAYALAKYTRSVLGSDDLDFRVDVQPEGRELELAALAGRESATYRDIEDAPVILTVGLDPEEEAGVVFLRIRKAWRNNRAKLVSVGPRAGSIAPYAWRRLATMPGDEAIALAAIGRDVGLAKFASTAVDSGWHSGHLADVVGSLKATPGAVILVGERAGVNALTMAGQIAEHVGAKVAWIPARAGTRGALEAGLCAGLLPGARRIDDAEDREFMLPEWGELPTQVGRSFEQIIADAAAGKIDVLHLVGVDLLADAPDRALAEKALKRVKTVIAQDLSLTETVAAADIVLPAVATAERRGSLTNFEGRKQSFAPAVAAPDLAQQDFEILVQLAAVQGKDLGFSDLAQLQAEQVRVGRRPTAHAWPTIATPEAARDASTAATAEADGSLLAYSHRLLLDRGVMTEGADDLLATAKDPFVAINVLDAERLGIADGDEVTLSTPAGELHVVAQVEYDIVVGVVFVPRNSTDTGPNALGDLRAMRVQIRARQEVSP
ncbi:MAG: NADH-quinone oxidoreductase subunit G [Glaciecola sp.]|jgi:NADH-quinone oxidoreductase subunit G